MAQAAGLTHAAIARPWRALELTPHVPGTFNRSCDPFFVGNVRDIGGLDLTPPERAIGRRGDEKSQGRALTRTRPIRPMTPGQAGRGPPDYERHGVAALLAALHVATGQVIGEGHRRHRRHEFVKCLGTRDATIPAEEGVAIPRIADAAATPETPRGPRWLVERPRFIGHLTPTSGSWLNQAERFFAAIAAAQIRRGSFRRVNALEQSSESYREQYNKNAKPFVWTASAELILKKVEKVCKRTSNSGH